MTKKQSSKIPRKPGPRTEYSPRVRVIAPKSGDGLAQQSFKDQCDINNILKRHQAGDVLYHVKDTPPQYMEVEPMDYREALQLAKDVQDRFDSLPSNLRSKYENDPELFLADLQRQQTEEKTSQNTADTQETQSGSDEPGSVDTRPTPSTGNASAASEPQSTSDAL